MKIFIPNTKENWIIDRIRKEWYEHSNEYSTKKSFLADIVWITAPWTWNKLFKSQLKSKLVVCTIHHLEINNQGKDFRDDFEKLDRYVDFYHVPSLKTLDQLTKLTTKKIFQIPYWVNGKNFYYIKDKSEIRKKYGFEKSDFLIGSFQRDTEGFDLMSPKLIKGPDIFIKNVKNLYLKNNKIKVVLTGNRRQYVINELNKLRIPYSYFEMADSENLNELYNILNLYIISSRIEGGPQAILECAISNTPIVSTDVGLASEVLHAESIYKCTINEATPKTAFARENVKKLEINNLISEYIKMFEHVHRSRIN